MGAAMSDKPERFSDLALLRQGFKLVARYPYTSRDGITLYEKLRYQKPDGNDSYEKTFLIRRPDRNGGYYSGMGDDTERALYRQQNIITAPLYECVHVGEGEKAADRAAKANLLATCVATGWN